MGIMDDVKKAAYAEAPRKIEANRNLTIEELYALLEPHADEFSAPFKLSGFLGKHIVFKRDPQLELQVLVTVKNNVITVRPNAQEVTVGSDNFSIRTVDVKQGGVFGAEFSRDDYVNDIVEKITRIVNG